MTFIYIFVVILIVLLLVFAGIYNSLVRKKTYIGEAWSSIDVQLKRKGNVLPNLIDTIKMQTNYEGELLTKLTAARTGITEGDSKSRMQENDALSETLRSFYAVAENYPSLGANESFRKLMDEIASCEDKIAYSRNRYNISVTSFNTALKIFPSNIVAMILGYKEEPFFEISQSQRTDYDNMRIKDIK